MRVRVRAPRCIYKPDPTRAWVSYSCPPLSSSSSGLLPGFLSSPCRRRRLAVEEQRQVSALLCSALLPHASFLGRCCWWWWWWSWCFKFLTRGLWFSLGVLFLFVCFILTRVGGMVVREVSGGNLFGAWFLVRRMPFFCGVHAIWGWICLRCWPSL